MTARVVSLGRRALSPTWWSVIILTPRPSCSAAERHRAEARAAAGSLARHHSIFLLILRRMRAPLILLIAVDRSARAHPGARPGHSRRQDELPQLLPRLLLHQLHRDHDRVWRDPYTFSDQQRLGDRQHLPVRDRLGLYARLVFNLFRRPQPAPGGSDAGLVRSVRLREPFTWCAATARLAA